MTNTTGNITPDTTDLEAIYDALAEGIDKAGDEKRDLFFAKLALLLAQEVNDRARVTAAIDTALLDL